MPLSYTECSTRSLKATEPMYVDQSFKRGYSYSGGSISSWQYSESSLSVASSAASSAAPANSQSRKRPSNDTQSRPNKRKRCKISDTQELIHAATYGAHLLSVGFAAYRAINLVVKDDQLHVWVYDRQGAVQSEGINFVENLDYLVILLFGLQRFTSSDWGLLREFSWDRSRVIDEFSGWNLTLPASVRDDEKEIVLKLLDTEIAPFEYRITGRSTRVYLAEREGRANDSVILKLCSIGEYQVVPEEALIAEAHKRAPHLADHLPKLFRSYRFKQSRTGDLRTALCAQVAQGKDKNPYGGHQELKAFVFETLKPVKRLSGQTMLRMFLDCFKCHYKLYKKGILHRDISVNNLMCRQKRSEDGSEVLTGVLNDFDMAIDLHSSRSPSHLLDKTVTGTQPFMAIDLLRNSLKDTKHLYRHDAESFVWVLLDLATAYSDGVRKNNYPMEDWFDTEPSELCSTKLMILVVARTRDDYICRIADENLQQVVWQLLQQLKKILVDDINPWKENCSGSDGGKNRSTPEPLDTEERMDDIYGQFLKVI